MSHESLSFRRDAEPVVSDEALVERFRGGEERAWTELQKRYENRLTGFLRRFIQRDEDLKEVVNDVFLHASQKIGQFKGKSSFASWLFRIGRNTASNHLRSFKRLYARVKPVGHLEAIAGTMKGDPETAVLHGEVNDRIREALSELSKDQRDAYMLIEIDGHEYKEVSVALGVPEETLRVRVHRAKARLREILFDLDLEGREAA